jgi:hypothetical protein
MRREDPDGGRRIVEQMVEQRQHTNVSPVGIAWAFGTQGRADEAIAWLERGIEEHDTLVGFLHIYTPWFAPALMHDPRFAAILERLGLARVPGAPSGV